MILVLEKDGLSQIVYIVLCMRVTLLPTMKRLLKLLKNNSIDKEMINSAIQLRHK